MISFLNKAGGGGKPNIFIQEDEPTIKDGIWFKKAKSNYNKLIVTDSLTATPYFELLGKQLYDHSISAPIAIGNDIYMFGAYSTPGTKVEKYNVVTKEFTALPDIEFSEEISTFYLGDNIIRIEGYKKNCDFNIAMGTMSPMNTRDTAFSDNANALVYKDGKAHDFDMMNHYILDVATNTVSDTTGAPVRIVPTQIWEEGSDEIYLINCYTGSADANYKYKISTNTYTKLAAMPDGCEALGAASLLNGKIHVFGTQGPATDRTAHYVYDIVSDTWSKGLENVYGNGNGRAVTIGNSIYITQSSADTSYNHILKYTEPVVNFDPNSVVIQNGNTYSTALLTQPANTEGKLVTKFNNIYTTDNAGEIITTEEKYYGNGTDWVLIN